MSLSFYARRFLREEEGLSLIEYALLLALIGIIALAATASLGGRISAFFSSVSATI